MIQETPGLGGGKGCYMQCFVSMVDRVGAAPQTTSKLQKKKCEFQEQMALLASSRHYIFRPRPSASLDPKFC